jgi:hypothetical protein
MAMTVKVAVKKKTGGKSGKKVAAAEMHVRKVGNKFITMTHAAAKNPGEYQAPAEDIHDNLAALHDHMDNSFGGGGQDTAQPVTDADNDKM